jgi:hypothetical protein
MHPGLLADDEIPRAATHAGRCAFARFIYAFFLADCIN